MVSGRLWWEPRHGEYFKANSEKHHPRSNSASGWGWLWFNAALPPLTRGKKSHSSEALGPSPRNRQPEKNPPAEVSPPGPGQQPQLPQKTPRIPSWVSQGKSLPLSVLLASTLSLYNMHQRVKRCFATASFLRLLAALHAIHPFATFSPARCPSHSPHASECRLRARRSPNAFAAKRPSCGYAREFRYDSGFA